MARFIEGADRRQAALLPESLDDYVDADNPVRVVDAYVDALDLTELGFDGVEPEATGRPGYHPATMLKIYLYGYLNQIQSSRRLERECRRNVELMWLVGQLTPDFKTIADFRRDNGPAIRKVCRQFVALCRNLHLLDEARVAIDGSKFKAVNNREKNFTHDRLKRRIAAIEETIDRYLAELDRADRQAEVTGVPVSAVKIAALSGRIDALKAKMQTLAALEAKLVASGENQISLTDPDARGDDFKEPQRLHRAKRRRDQAPSDRDARGDERRHRQWPSVRDGRAGARCARSRRDRGARRQRLLRQPGDRRLRGRRHRRLCSETCATTN